MNLASSTASKNDDMVALEKQVIASAQAQIDVNRLRNAFNDNDSVKEQASTNSQWKIALASASVAGAASYLVINHNVIISGIIFFMVCYIANIDPLDEQDDNLGGALARFIGRVTLRGMQVSQPKVKAVARAVITGEQEIVVLKRRVSELSEQVKELEQWKRQKLFVDGALGRFTLDELKERARRNELAVGGSKAQLLMRLVENGVVPIYDDKGDNGNLYDRSLR
ncbi:hypothetical protein MPSEU_000966500 [Mayamaea pseudoterrestris]|nr:hypothetical protein MPSEU_000966500 [Mayamaea pseudoterrestris]